ncbi:unnamed protein product [Fusarium venenatum]|uniref:Uncharacterized protein n=1 Tax=Fusarium venenatum TaxID=56646 RepID=A0A2L2SUL5_9HYPO|nr:uncharacterized protein FVRRES_13932 [Fusarium venenatum]CEI42195.1 unnamed protein product [Fusarium venenatum]
MCRRYIDRIWCSDCGNLLDQKFEYEYCKKSQGGVSCKDTKDYIRMPAMGCILRLED